MSANLDLLDTAKPVGSTEFVSSLDDYIRELKTQLKDWADVEHIKTTGRHKFSIGNTAARPATPATGQVYINTETGALEYYTGSAWAPVNNSSHTPLHAYIDGAGTGATLYMGNGNISTPSEVLCSVLLATNGTLKNLRIKVSTSPGVGQTYTYTVMKNGVATTITCTISGAAATTASDLTHTVTVAAGDTYSVRMVESATAVPSHHKFGLQHWELP